MDEPDGLYKLLHNAGFTDRHARVLMTLSHSVHLTQDEITQLSCVGQGDMVKVLKEYRENGWLTVRKVRPSAKLERIEGLKQYRRPEYGNHKRTGAQKEYKLRANLATLIPDMVKKYGKKKGKVLELLESVRGGYS